MWVPVTDARCGRDAGGGVAMGWGGDVVEAVQQEVQFSRAQQSQH